MNYRILKIFLLLFIWLFTFQAKSQNACAFTYEIDYEISDLTVNFESKILTDGKVSSYFWNFGDGQTSLKSNPQHQFLLIGDYIVSLEVKFVDKSTAVYIDTISLEETYYRSCQCFFSYKQLSSVPYTVKFQDHSGFSPNDTIISWQWSFGDGSTSSTPSPVHQYPTSGTYNVSLTITTYHNCSSTHSESVIVSGTPVQCESDFSFVTDTNTANTIIFHDESISVDSLISWNWKFDDGDSSSFRDPTHTFPFAGYYYVSLNVVDNQGRTSTKTKLVKVGNPKQYNVWGRVYAGANLIDKCIALMYADYGNGYHKPIDTVDLTSINDTLGVYYFYQQFEGDYKVKLLVPEESSFYKQFAPTYFGDMAFWNSASSVNLFQDLTNQNISLIPAAQIFGYGYISGIINNNANSEYSKANVEVLLMQNGNIIDYTFSNDTGFFEFKDVPSGSYNIYGEITGLNGIPLNINLGISDTISNLEIFIRNKQVTGIINDKNFDIEKNSFEIFPNPTTNFINIRSKLNTEIEEIYIYNVQGGLIKTIEANSREIQINIENLDKGVYFININKSAGYNSRLYKIIKL